MFILAQDFSAAILPVNFVAVGKNVFAQSLSKEYMAPSGQTPQLFDHGY